MDGDRIDFPAVGVYNQFVYVIMRHGVVIVELSANRHYGTTKKEHSVSELDTIDFFCRICDRVSEL